MEVPWGHTGTSLNAVCMAGIYHRFSLGQQDTRRVRDARCFMHQQLGYLLNHKCDTAGSSCNTPDAEGFSYMVGCAAGVVHARFILCSTQERRIMHSLSELHAKRGQGEGALCVSAQRGKSAAAGASSDSSQCIKAAMCVQARQALSAQGTPPGHRGAKLV